MEIAARIMSARKRKGISQERLAAMLGISRSACGQWERSVTCPSVVHLAHLAQLLEVRFEWLSTGRGEMEYSSGVHEKDSGYAAGIPGLPGEHKELVEAFSRLSRKQQNMLLAFLKTLS